MARALKDSAMEKIKVEITQGKYAGITGWGLEDPTICHPDSEYIVYTDGMGYKVPAHYVRLKG